ncbi:uncharacterized protein LOC118745604 isoform X1 [Rhagoletis pomonella]|uniref:uncharacterized protein LOC118745604 isoform X1 n=1 Tax=Rhagoletis pomonella TaxID=28610 RepID=UPI001785B01A|nr:uncharacterized protein LOC118745604 isoform X1 [Rhagoletis pomonella]
MNVEIMCKASSGKKKSDRNTKPVIQDGRDKLLEDLLISMPTYGNNILPQKEKNSHSPSCQERTKSFDHVYATSTNCSQFSIKSKESSHTILAKSQLKKRSTANKALGFEIFYGFGSGVNNENDAKMRGKKRGKRLLRLNQASEYLVSCNLESSKSSTKSFQRQSEERIIAAAMPNMSKCGPDNAHDNADGASDLPTSALFSNKPRQSDSHHKTKCRNSRTYRSQVRSTSAIAPGIAAADAPKPMATLPDTPSTQKITTATWVSASPQTSETFLTNPLLETMSTTPVEVASLAPALLEFLVFPKAWQQIVTLLRNSVEDITSPSKLSMEGVKSAPEIARRTTKNAKSVNRLQEQSITATATLTSAAAAPTAGATVARYKVAAEAILPVHSSSSSSSRTKFRLLPSLGATSFFTLLTLICLETVLLSTVSNCAKTFYMHWNTSNSIFRIDNTDHIIDVNKGNLAFEFDQVHIICPVYEPGTFENETEKYIIYNVSKVEYETCRITNADPRVIAICDKPQKLMFFTITFRPFTPQPGGLEFLPGNDYYFISTSSKDDLYRRIGGRCSTNNMKVVFKVCCAPEEKNKTLLNTGLSSGTSSGGSSNAGSVGIGINSADGSGMTTGIDNSANVDVVNTQSNLNQHQHINNINTIGMNGVNTGLIPIGGVNIGISGGVGTNNGGMVQMKPMNGASGTSINTNIDQFNRIPIQAGGINVMGNNIGGLGGIGLGGHGGGGIMLTPGGHGGINMISSGGGIGIGQYPGHPGQTGIRINNVASQQHHATHKNNNNNGKDAGAGSVGVSDDVSVDGGSLKNINFGDAQFLPPFINTNHSNIVQSTINWPGWGRGGTIHSINHNITTTTRNDNNINEKNNNYYSPSHRPINNKTNTKNDHYDKHPNEVVKNEELTYNSGATSVQPSPLWKAIGTAVSWPVVNVFGWLLSRSSTPISMSSCNTCRKDQQVKASLDFQSSFHITQSDSKSFLFSYMHNLKHLILNYKKVMILKFSETRQLGENATTKNNAVLPSRTTGAANSSSLAINAFVPHVLQDTFHTSVKEKLTLIDLKSAFVKLIPFKTVGLKKTSANAIASMASASASTQSFVVVWQVENNTTSNRVWLNLPLIKYCRSQKFSVSVKVIRFR